jgi:beta-lactamase superfamily II metal-dependent hydrolase
MKPAAALLLALFLPASSTARDRGLEIYWVDVEGGAATLIIAPSGESLLVDTGSPGERDPGRIRDVAVKAAGLKRIDHLLCTHWDIDHYGGVEELAKLLPIGKFYDHGFPEGTHRGIDPKLKAAYLRATGGKSTVLKPGDAIPLKGVKVRIIVSGGLIEGEAPGTPQVRPCEKHPPHKEDLGENARSVGFLLSLGAFDFLDVGDITWNVEHRLACPKNLIGKVDVYQVTHHGLSSSNNPALVRAVAPTVAIMNNGYRKGCKPVVFKTLMESPELKDLFQLHRNLTVGDEGNAPSECIANDAEKCKGTWIRLRVDPSGASYTVEVPSKGTKRTYRCK